jgi:nucleoside 2-deoxyribosyltransferase
VRPQVYVAGSSHELDRVTRIADKLEALGVAISHRWWLASGVGNDGALDREAQASVASQCLAGVARADVCWLLWPRDVSHGTAVELGYALGLGHGYRPIVITGSRAHTCAFTSLATYRDVCDELGLVEVLRLLNLGAEVRT